MGYFLKTEDGQFLKAIDNAEGTIEFTDSIKEAKNYSQGSWFAETELDYIKFHFKEEPKAQSLRVFVT